MVAKSQTCYHDVINSFYLACFYFFLFFFSFLLLLLFGCACSVFHYDLINTLQMKSTPSKVVVD